MGVTHCHLAVWVHAKPPVEEESTRCWELRGDATQHVNAPPNSATTGALAH